MLSAAKSCVRRCCGFHPHSIVGRSYLCTSALFSPSPPTPPRLFDKTPKLLMELRGEDTALLRKVYEWMKTPLLHVPISPERTLIYKGGNEMLSVCFDKVPDDPKLAVSPILQIYAISIHANFEDDQRPIEICGSIRANDGKGSTFELYETTISKDHDLLIGPGGGSIPCFVDTPTSLNFSLVDKTRKVEVVNGILALDSKFEDFEESCDRLLRGCIHDRHGSATVYYSTFRFAVFAVVKVAIFGSHRPFNDLYGSIVAKYSNPKRYCTSDDDFKYLESVLFKRLLDQSVHMEVGNFIPLSRYVVAVPVCSSLVVDVDLWDSEAQFAKFSSEFSTNDSVHLTKLIEIEGKGSILVDVVWRDPYTELLYRSRLKRYNRVTVNEKIGDKDSYIAEEKNFKTKEENDTEEKIITKSAKKGASKTIAEYRRHYSNVAGNNDAYENIKTHSEMLDDQQHFLSIPSPWSPADMCSADVSKNGRCLVEVFSVYICGTSHKVSSLCGTINVGCGSSSFYLYERPWNNPEKLMPERSILSVGAHSAITSSCVHLEFDLKDADSDLEISKGCLYHHQIFGFWCNRNLCSVIRGAHGYAAVHYALFDNAVQATVQLIFSFNNSVPNPDRADVYGNLVAYYGNRGYSTTHEKKYYRSQLFDKPKCEPVQLSHGCEISLLKSVVVVPLKYSLVIEADLRVSCLGKPVSQICGVQTFEIDLSDAVSKKFYVDEYYIQVKVKFDDAAHLI